VRPTSSSSAASRSSWTRDWTTPASALVSLISLRGYQDRRAQGGVVEEFAQSAGRRRSIEEPAAGTTTSAR
jgi:hypothetical protein